MRGFLNFRTFGEHWTTTSGNVIALSPTHLKQPARLSKTCASRRREYEGETL
jgi:hypothetical protein